MKAVTIIILSLFFSLAAIAQQPEYPDSGFTNKADAKNLTINGLKEGKWVAYCDVDENCSDDSTINEFTYYLLTEYKADKIFGIERWIYKNGKIASIIPYKNGEKNGIEKWYFENGAIMGVYPYSNGKENGVSRTYFNNGKLHFELTYSMGKVNGNDKEYYISGILKSETPYIDDKRTGVEKDYYPGGTIKEEEPYINDKINGTKKEYELSGRMASEATYANGIQMEYERKYYADEHNDSVGIKNSTDTGFKNKDEAKNLIVNGLKEGKWIEYYTDEAEEVTDSVYADFYKLVIYKSGIPMGVEREYYSNSGKLSIEETYYKGFEISEKRYNENGKLLSETKYTDGIFEETKHYDKDGNEIKQ